VTAYPWAMSLSQPSRTIVVEPLRVSTAEPAPAPDAAPAVEPAPAGEPAPAPTPAPQPAAGP
jgi:hypothetical protein